jgi:hypothetical protein
MATQVEPFTIFFPEWYDERAAFETPAKGYLRDVEVRLQDGSRHRLFFIDPVRLQQDLEADVEGGRPYYAEPGMVVLPEVTTESVRRAVAGLWHDGYFKPARVPDVTGREET